ncbi:hypothetical protein VDGL01_06327 [Verticillium dahliae]
MRSGPLPYAVRVEAFGSDAYSLFETNSGPRETEDRDFDLDDRRRVGAEVAMLFVAVGALKWERNPLDEDVLVMTFPWAMYSCPCCRATSWTLNRNRRCLASILPAGAAVHLAQLVNSQSLPKEEVRCMTACADLHPRRLRGKCMVEVDMAWIDAAGVARLRWTPRVDATKSLAIIR